MRSRARVLAVALALAPATETHAAEPDPKLLAGGIRPAERAEDGRFVNLAGKITRAGPTTTLPFFLRRAGMIFTGRDDPPPQVANDGAFLRENARASVPTVTWIGHATLLVQMQHQTFLTDPIWAERASPFSFAGPRRMQPPGVALDDLPPIDFVLISHNHYDHLDLASLAEIALRNPTARFFVPLENGALLREAGIPNVEELGWGDVATSRDLRIHCLPTQHWSARGLFDDRKALWASWAVTGPGERFYFAGDTGYFPELAAIGAVLGPFDLAAVPIGAYRPEEMMRPFHMSPEEAVRAGRDLEAHRLVGIHFGTFDLSDEPPSEPPARFRAAGVQAGYDPEDMWILAIGETRELVASGADAERAISSSSASARDG
ncbi:MAG: MBL fold metallo-hydrolase [Deltaproteobacteria bacterium]|nr:MBL fold metallo-hydrolase [Deltaproteobacteria bacterium]